MMKVLNNGEFYAFPLQPGEGLRSKFWQQILLICKEYSA